MRIKLILLIILAEAFICVAQFLFKSGANKLKMHDLNTFSKYKKFLRSSLMIPAIWGGVLLNGFAIVVWLIVLALVDLSLAIPLDSVHYIVILFGSHFLLKERLSWDRIAGTFLIIAGIVFVAMS